MRVTRPTRQRFLLGCKWTLALFLILVMIGGILWYSLMPGAYWLSSAASPFRLGTLQLLAEGDSFPGKSVWVYVRDPATHTFRAAYIGGPYASDGPVKMRQAVWSKDGTVVAVRADVGSSVGHGFARYDGEFFVSAYDFKTHRSVPNTAPVRVTSEAISRLIALRGGQGPVAFTEPYGLIGKPINWLQAQLFPGA